MENNTITLNVDVNRKIGISYLIDNRLGILMSRPNNPSNPDDLKTTNVCEENGKVVTVMSLSVEGAKALFNLLDFFFNQIYDENKTPEENNEAFEKFCNTLPKVDLT